MGFEFFTDYTGRVSAFLLALPGAFLSLLKINRWFSKKKEPFQAKILKSSAEVIDSFHTNLKEIRQTSNEISILNIGLDLEHISPWLKGYLAAEENRYISIKYQGLILNPESLSVKSLINGESNIKEENIRESIFRMQEMSGLGENIDIKLRKCDYLSPFSGFVLNNKHIYIAPSFIRKGSLIGGSHNQWIYIRVDGNIRIHKEILKMFASWLNILEENSKECW